MKRLELGGNQGGSSTVKSSRPPDVGLWTWLHSAMCLFTILPGKSQGTALRGWVMGETREMTTRRSHELDVNTERAGPGAQNGGQGGCHSIAILLALSVSLPHSGILYMQPSPQNKQKSKDGKELLCKQLLFFHLHPWHTYISLTHSKSLIIGSNVW